MKPTHQSTSTRISIVIPTYNRRDVVTATIRGLCDQEDAGLEQGRPVFELIVVDDGSTDGTLEALAKLRDSLPFPFRLIAGSHSGPGVARNIGTEAAASPLILFIDSDLIPGRRLVAGHLRGHAAGGNRIVHGPVIQVETLDIARARRQKARITDMSRGFFATTNVSIARKHLLAAGLFDAELSRYAWWEDLELGERLRALPEKLEAVWIPEAAGYHYKPPLRLADLERVCRREVQRAQSALIFYRKHPTWAVRRKIPLSRLVFAIERLISLGDWPASERANRLLEMAERAGWRRLFQILAWIKIQHAYYDTLRRELRVRG
ncbi:MAG: glycosyltransferase family 2 protein [Limnochordales bacterium]|nr:glycosyltransferase family 2 protein [Limnochordales bacterium]